MNSTNGKTTVIFRRWRDNYGGGIVAIFPYIPGTIDANHCMAYEHVGQHGAASIEKIITRTTPTKQSDEDVLALRRELVAIGYRLHITRKFPLDAQQARRVSILDSLRG